MSNWENRTPAKNEVLFELSRQLVPEDMDILSLFLENRKQSGGGDILHVEDQSRSLRVVYEDDNACQRVLAKKFLQFQSYYMRASERGYKINEIYELDTTRIILKNINNHEEVCYLRESLLFHLGEFS